MRELSHSRFALLAVASLLLALGYTAAVGLHNAIPSAHGVSRQITLDGSFSTGWNGTSPGPTITVTQGDTISLKLVSVDRAAHTFIIDVAKAGIIESPNCRVDKCSGEFSSSATFPFTADMAPGTYSYYCSLHLFPMIGSFIVQALPDFGLYSNPSSLRISEGSAGESTVTVNETDSSSGNVTLSASIQPSGPTLHLNPLRVNFSSTVRTAVVTLSVTVPLGTAITGYTITVTGNNGTLSHSATIALNVVAGPMGTASLPPAYLLAATAILVSGVVLVIGAAIYVDRRRRSHPQ